MAFNGSGVFSRIYSWANDATSAINISSSRMDTEDTGFASGLTNCICKDGQTTITADLPMATHKHTGVGNATAATHYAAAGQVQNSSLIYLGTTGGTNTVTGSVTPTLIAYAAGQLFAAVAGGTCTGAVTLNINSLGAKAVQKLGAALVAGDITANDGFLVEYDGTQFQLLSPARTPVLKAGSIPASAVSGGIGALVLLGTATASASSTLDFTSLISSAYSKYIIVFRELLNSASASIGLKVSKDNGSTWTVNIYSQREDILVGTNTVPLRSNVAGTTPAVLTEAGANPFSGRAEFIAGVSNDIVWESNLSIVGSGAGDASKAYVTGGDGGAPINAIRLLPSSGNFTSGTVYLYGVKNT